MGIFKKLIGKSKKKANSKEENTFMPEIKRPIDERFTINFKKNGGKFLYCETLNEVHQNFEAILQENQWQNETALLLNPKLYKAFKPFKLKATSSIKESIYFLTTCEFLIADDGSILLSSNQIGQDKLKTLPKHFIVYATTSQLTENISEGLKGIKAKSKGNIPTNITTIKHFKATDDNNFLSYGFSTKNTYLLLLEDL